MTVSPGSAEMRLVRAATLGDEQAFAQLVDAHGPRMLRFAVKMGADEQEAADAVQEALVSAWRNLPTFAGRSSFRTWLFRLLHRRVVDGLRRRRPTPLGEVVEESVDAGRSTAAAASHAAGDPERIAIERELVTALNSALLELPSTQRACWLLREVEEMAYDEIADTLGTTPGSVRGNLHRARQRLAQQMEAWR